MINPGLKTSARRRGIVLLEVLVAAAILGTAVLVLVRMQEGALRREAAAARLTTVARAARRLVAEAELASPPIEGVEVGKLQAVPGATFRRRVELYAQVRNVRLYRIHLTVNYRAGAEARAFELERYVFRGKQRAAHE